MKADYQVIGFIVGNPFFPLEPFSSYGQMINASYRIMQKQILNDLQDHFRLWRYDASEVSIFPLLDRGFDFLSAIKKDVDIIHDRGIRILPEVF